jgi:hypothetical protein
MQFKQEISQNSTPFFQPKSISIINIIIPQSPERIYIGAGYYASAGESAGNAGEMTAGGK